MWRDQIKCDTIFTTMADKADKMERLPEITNFHIKEQAVVRRREIARTQLVYNDVTVLTTMDIEARNLERKAEEFKKEAAEKRAQYEEEVEIRGPRIRETFLGGLKDLPPDRIEKTASQIMAHGIQLEKRPDKMSPEQKREFEQEKLVAHQEKKAVLGKITKLDVMKLISTIANGTPTRSEFVKKQQPESLQFEFPIKPKADRKIIPELDIKQ